MFDNFQNSLDFVLRHECVYAAGHEGDLDYVITEHVPRDSGGCTKYGIDAASHPDLSIPNLTLGAATEIYHQGEWTKCLCDRLPRGLDTAVFDCAVNNGVAVSGILLQRGILACEYGVTVDGEIGMETLRGANLANGPELITRVVQLRRERYADIVLHHPADAKFLKGWLNRVDDLEKLLLS